MSESKIIEILDRWETSWEQGQRLEVADLCSDCPELAALVEKRIKALQSTAWMHRQMGDGTVTWTNDSRRLAHELNLPPTLGRYRLDRRIGIGGFGQVWLGFDPELHREVAIKVARPDRVGSDAQSQKFLSEARKVARLRHTNIVPIHDFGREQQLCFIVSEYLSGGDLSQQLANGPLPPRDAVRIVIDVCAGLEHAHEEGFVHRDIKPANILLDEAGRPALTDFGIAATTDELRDHTATGGGTLYYMSPEQLGENKIGDRPIDERSDIYSLGVVLVELLTGKRPFAGIHPLRLREEILRGEAVFAPGQMESIPPELERICRKCLAVDPAHRYPSAGHLADDLRHWLHPPAQSPVSDGSWWRTMTTASIVAAVLLLLVFAIDRYNRWREEVRTSQEWGSPEAQLDLANMVINRSGFLRVEGSGDDIRALGNIPKQSFGITFISLKNLRLPEEKFEMLAKVPSIRTLELTGSDTSDAASHYLKQLRRLRNLYLGDTNITDASFPQLVALEDLEVLNVEDTGIGDVALIHISKMAKLRELYCSRTNISDTGLAAIASLPALAHLEVDGNSKITDKGLAHLAKCASLEDFSGSKTGITDEGLRHLAGLLSLRRLQLKETRITAAGLKLLAGIPQLASLDLNNVPLGNDAVGPLSKLSTLKTLNLDGCGLDGAALAALRQALPKCEIVP